MRNNILHTAGILSLLIVGAVSAAVKQPVRVEGGLVSGVPNNDPSILIFKGIPFAAPPVGGLRWQAPKPVTAWQGVRKADKLSASCMQNISGEFKPYTSEFMTHGDVSEDCLYLNVWTSAKSAAEKRPVFVYIYGGGFSSGSAQVPIYDGEGLAKKGLVVVTFNYRVGLMGFFAHPELSKESGHGASGNYGLLDQIAVLQWIRKNIAGFGGDPGRVTVTGQSAGAMSVQYLTASPLAHGLFQRAIVESGGLSVNSGGMSLSGLVFGGGTLAAAEAAGLKLAEAKGAKSLADLRALDYRALTESEAGASGRAGTTIEAQIARLRAGATTSAPIIDGYVVPAAVHEVISQGKQNDVVTLSGVNLGEIALVGGTVTLVAFRNQARQRFGTATDQFLKLYPASNDDEAAVAALQSGRDQALASLYLWSKERSRTGKTKAYGYLFDHSLPGPDAQRYGAFHSAEIPYALNTLYTSDRPFTDEDRKIADMMSSYWANFAATGDPNGKGLAVWPPFGEKPEIMELGDKTGSIPIAGNAARLSFFEKFLAR